MIMHTKKIAIGLAAACLSVLGAAGPAAAAEINVVSSGGPLPEVMGALIPIFERESGSKVTIKFQGVADIVKRVKEGDGVDLVITDDTVVDGLAKDGAIAAGDSAKVMLSRIAIAVREGADRPDVRSADALKTALTNAKSVAYSQGASGQHFVSVIGRLGLADALKPKTVVVQGKPVGAAIAAGEAEIGVQQFAELLPIKGVTIIGPLPGDLQKTIVYAAGVPAKAKEAAAARALIKFLKSEEAASMLKVKGMDPG